LIRLQYEITGAAAQAGLDAKGKHGRDLAPYRHACAAHTPSRHVMRWSSKKSVDCIAAFLHWQIDGLAGCTCTCNLTHCLWTVCIM
jgi:hypothetical protein